MYNLSGKYLWDVDPETKEIILTKNQDYSSTDVVLNNLPKEMYIKPEDLISFDISDMTYPGRGAVATAGTAAIGTALLGPLGLLMGLGASAMTVKKENQKNKKVYFQFRRDNDNNQYEFEGIIPSKLLYLLDGIINSPDFGKKSSLGESTNQALEESTSKEIKEIHSININLNQNDPTPTIERIKLFLEDGDWDSATQYCNAALDLFPTNSYFYILKYCAKNEIKKIEHLNNEAHGKLYGDDDFQRALRFSSDNLDDAKALYENSLQRAFDDVTEKESNSLSSHAYTKMQHEMEAIPNYKPAQEKAKEYSLCAASALISEKKNEYHRIKVTTNSNNHKSMIGAIHKYKQLVSVVKNNRKKIKTYIEAGIGDPDDLMFEETIETTMQETRNQLYELACAYMVEYTITSLENAQESFEYLGNYRDSNNKLNEVNQGLEAKYKALEAEKLALKAEQKALELENLYDKARVAENDKNYDEAIRIYQSLGDYKDSQQRIKEAEAAKWEAERKEEYNKAVQEFNSGNNKKAIIAFESLGDYKDSKDYLNKAESAAKKRTKIIVAIVAVIAIVVAGVGVGAHTYQVKKAEKMRLNFVRKSEKMKPAIEEALLNNSTGLVAGNDGPIGLKKDGTVVCANWKQQQWVENEYWEDIIAVDAGGHDEDIVGLKKDGTVCSLFKDEEVGDWEDIVAISNDTWHIVGLKKDGTVVSTKIGGDHDVGQTEVGDWEDIVAVSAEYDYTVGLKKDGTVVSTKIKDKDDDAGQTEVEDWKDIVAISTGLWHTVGLKKDGTVVSTKIKDKDDDAGQTEVEDWKDIIAVSAGDDYTVGLKKDGTVVCTKMIEVEGWKDIIAVSAGENCIVGLKKDGTVVCTEKIEVEGWKDIINNGYKYLSR